jgi:amino acid adenylation domain-containing protein
VDDPALERHPCAAPSPLATPEDLAYVIYTSGSTGRPKGVMIEHRNLTNLLMSMAQEPGLGPEDTLLGVTTPAFDLSVPDLYLPLVTGATLLLAKPEEAVDPRALARLLDGSEVTVMQATPSTWRMLLEDGWTPSRPMRVVVGGEAVPPALAAQLRELMDGVWNFYGPTETTVWSTCWRVGELGGVVPIGRPIANTRCYVLDGAGEPVPTGVLGELHIGGAGVARGYLGRPELTAEKFIADPFREGGRLYRTGDLVRLRSDGLLEFQGRSDHQVKLRGFRIELGEIEAVLGRHRGVSQALAHVREDVPGDQRLVGYVVGDVPAEELLELARLHLPEHMVPGAIVLLKALPLTPNGKIDRRVLPAPTGSSEQATTPPRTPLEEHLIELWREVLGVEKIGIHDSFFALGGHSLLVTKVLARVRSAFGVDVPLRRVYEAPTVAQLAQIVASALIDSEERSEMELLLAELEQLPDEGVSGTV